MSETRTQAMIAEETCASHALSSTKRVADIFEPRLTLVWAIYRRVCLFRDKRLVLVARLDQL